MSVADLADLGAADLGRLFRAGKASPVEATRAALDRVAIREPDINAFVVVDGDGAVAAAKASEERHRRGTPLGPLDGVTATVKDVVAMAGLPMRRGSRLTPSTPALADAPVVARLRAAGCVILGKTTTSEQGWSALSTSPLTGMTHNPWRRGTNAGGSSAGAAAAAASGMGVLHVGTDGAGSVRLPAHFCGVTGIKASFGAVPYVPVPNSDGLSHVGPIARRLDDAVAMLAVMAGPDARDPTTLPRGLLDMAPEGAGQDALRLAYSPDLGHLRVDPEVRAVVGAAVRRLADGLGAAVEEVAPPWGPDGPALIEPFWAVGFHHHLDRPDNEVAMLDPGFVACLRGSPPMPLADYIALRGRRMDYAAAVNTWLGGYDALVTPAASVAAFDPVRIRPPHWPGHPHDWIAWAGFSYPFNLSHAPAIVLPAGQTSEGLPVGLQLVAPRLHDARLLRLAARVEAVVAGSWAAPPLPAVAGW